MRSASHGCCTDSLPSVHVPKEPSTAYLHDSPSTQTKQDHRKGRLATTARGRGRNGTPTSHSYDFWRVFCHAPPFYIAGSRYRVLKARETRSYIRSPRERRRRRGNKNTRPATLENHRAASGSLLATSQRPTLDAPLLSESNRYFCRVFRVYLAREWVYYCGFGVETWENGGVRACCVPRVSSVPQRHCREGFVIFISLSSLRLALGTLFNPP